MSLAPDRMNMPGVTWLNLMGRLNPGVQAQQASADLTLVLPQLPASVAQVVLFTTSPVETGYCGGSGLRDGFAAPLTILMAVVTESRP